MMVSSQSLRYFVTLKREVQDAPTSGICLAPAKYGTRQASRPAPRVQVVVEPSHCSTKLALLAVNDYVKADLTLIYI